MLTLPAKLLTFKSTSTPSCGTLQLLSFSTTNLASSLLCGFVSHSVLSDALRPNGLQSTKLLCPWNSPDKNTGVGSHSLLQGIFPTQGLNPCLLHCRQILLLSEPPGKPFTDEKTEVPRSGIIGPRSRFKTLTPKPFYRLLSVSPPFKTARYTR